MSWKVTENCTFILVTTLRGLNWALVKAKSSFLTQSGSFTVIDIVLFLFDCANINTTSQTQCRTLILLKPFASHQYPDDCHLHLHGYRISYTADTRDFDARLWRRIHILYSSVKWVGWQEVNTVSFETKIEHRNKAGCRTEGGTGERWWAERGWGWEGRTKLILELWERLEKSQLASSWILTSRQLGHGVTSGREGEELDLETFISQRL